MQQSEYWKHRQRKVAISCAAMSLGDDALYLLISKFSEPPSEPPLNLVQTAIMECPASVHYKISHRHHSSPLHWAARYGFSALARVLLQNGALPNCEDDEGKTPLHYAAEGSGQPGAAAQLLCRGGHVDAVCAALDTPLHLAAMMGNTAVAAVLLMRGADPKRSCSDSFRPLHVAAFHGHGAVFALLCMYGGSITDIAADSYTPVDLARIQVIVLILHHFGDSVVNSHGLSFPFPRILCQCFYHLCRGILASLKLRCMPTAAKQALRFIQR